MLIILIYSYAGSHRKEENIEDFILKKSSKFIKISEKQFCLKYQNFKTITVGIRIS